MPRISYLNYKKEFKNLAHIDIKYELFSIKRYWYGRMIKISIRHRELTIDFCTREFIETLGREGRRKENQIGHRYNSN